MEGLLSQSSGDLAVRLPAREELEWVHHIITDARAATRNLPMALPREDEEAAG